MTPEQLICERVKAFYQLISGPAGAPRDWEAFRALFYPGATLCSYRKDADGKTVSKILNVEDYITGTQASVAARGLFEFTANERAQVYGNIAKLYNEYTGYEDAEKQNLLFSGKCVGIMQRAGDDWKIVSMLWESQIPA